MGSEHSVDGKKGALEIQFAFHKTYFSEAQTKIGQAMADKSTGWDRAVAAAAATTGEIDPAGVAVIAYQVDVSLISFSLVIVHALLFIDIFLFRSEPRTKSFWPSQMLSNNGEEAWTAQILSNPFPLTRLLKLLGPSQMRVI